MIVVRVKFFHNEWNNYQGAVGKTIEIEKLIEIKDDVLACNLRDWIICELNSMNYNDNTFDKVMKFTGRGIISITI